MSDELRITATISVRKDGINFTYPVTITKDVNTDNIQSYTTALNTSTYTELTTGSFQPQRVIFTNLMEVSTSMAVGNASDGSKNFTVLAPLDSVNLTQSGSNSYFAKAITQTGSIQVVLIGT